LKRLSAETLLRDAEPGTIDILTFGPLTSVARALERDASEGPRIAELVAACTRWAERRG
jgi:inosine-uridine nucleoside N-ribohydrolase